jgi:hypothetical protein
VARHCRRHRTGETVIPCSSEFGLQRSVGIRRLEWTVSHRVAARESVKSPSLREALGTPESVRTATHDRSPLGSRALPRPLNLADALSRLTLSGDFCRLPRTLRSARDSSRFVHTRCGHTAGRTRATMPSAPRSRKSAAAIPPRVFRPCVLVVSN